MNDEEKLAVLFGYRPKHPDTLAGRLRQQMDDLHLKINELMAEEYEQGGYLVSTLWRIADRAVRELENNEHRDETHIR